MDENKPRYVAYIILGVIVAIALIALVVYLSSDKKDTENGGVETTEEAVDALSGTPKIQGETNPVKKVPDLNPAEKTNPFKTRNPFE